MGSMTSYPIKEVEGIGQVYGDKLAAAGIKTTGQYLKRCCTPKGREELAQATGIAPGLVLTWANLADMMRLRGVGPQFAELLEAAGVDTVKELGNRVAENLAAKMKEVNAQKQLTRAVPVAKLVQGWIDQAKNTEPGITY